MDVPPNRASKEEMLAFKKECMRKHKDGKCLTLDETAFAIWDPKTQAKPMSPMGILKIERRALEKLKAELKNPDVKKSHAVQRKKLNVPQKDHDAQLKTMRSLQLRLLRYRHSRLPNRQRKLRSRKSR